MSENGFLRLMFSQCISGCHAVGVWDKPESKWGWESWVDRHLSCSPSVREQSGAPGTRGDSQECLKLPEERERVRDHHFSGEGRIRLQHHQVRTEDPPRMSTFNKQNLKEASLTHATLYTQERKWGIPFHRGQHSDRHRVTPFLGWLLIYPRTITVLLF